MFKKNVYYSFIILIILISVLMLVFSGSSYQRQCQVKILLTRTDLVSLRHSIDTFFNINGRYPNSINEAKPLINHDLHMDFKLKSQNDCQEFRELNDKGGYYYDPNTGTIKLNMTRPVKDYMPSYRGTLKDEIPSEW